MNSTDARTIALMRVLAGIRKSLGLKFDTRADALVAFDVTDAQIEELHAAIGRVISVAAKSTEVR